MEKNIQLPESAVRDLILLISDLKSYELDNETSATVERLETVIEAKIEAIEKRKAYTQYKTALSSGERESARQKYLDLAGMDEDWRWGAEAEYKRSLGIEPEI